VLEIARLEDAQNVILDILSERLFLPVPYAGRERAGGLLDDFRRGENLLGCALRAFGDRVELARDARPAGLVEGADVQRRDFLLGLADCPVNGAGFVLERT